MDALKVVGVPVASGPPEVVRMLVQHIVQQPQLLCPATLRDNIRSAKHAVIAACTADLRRAAVLLAYCLQDIDDRDPESCLELVGAGRFHEPCSASNIKQSGMQSLWV